MLDARSVVAIITVMVALCSVQPRAQRGNPPRAVRELRVTQWIELVRAHEPGRLDAAVRSLNTWNDEQLQQLGMGLSDAFSPRGETPIKSAEERLQLLRRGAVLHADAAMLTPVQDAAPTARPSLAPTSVLVDDGQQAGFGANSAHWAFGRMLIDFLVQPQRTADTDGFVSVWYRAASEFMIATGDYAAAQPHLTRGRQLLPASAHVWLASGVVRAYYATPSVQHVMSSIKVPFGFYLMIGDQQTELTQAERFLSRAVELEPGNAEAQTRLGWVLVQQKRLDAAVNALRAAQATAKEPVLKYYASLFLGVATGASGSYTAAADAFEQAARLFPNAQAPLLGSSDLAMRRGDRVAAAAALERLLALPVGKRDDPWWTYNIEYGRHWRATVDRLYELLRQSER